MDDSEISILDLIWFDFFEKNLDFELRAIFTAFYRFTKSEALAFCCVVLAQQAKVVR